MYKFASATRQELIIFGAERPRYTQKSISQWIKFMQQQKISRVCCLLETKPLAHYPIDLLETYRQQFAAKYVLWQPIKDFQLPSTEILIDRIIPFLISAEQNQQKTVVHCSGGVGRTGIVLASWLVSQRGYSNQEAIFAVQQNQRNPHEVVIAAWFRLQNPAQIKQQLDNLLNDCRSAFN